MKAIWNGEMLAESDDTIVIENNHYFPPQSIRETFFEKTNHQTECPWKGTAHYYTIKVNEERNINAAWYYPNPKKAVQKIADYVAFWKGVAVKE